MLDLFGVASTAFANDTFAGFSLCEVIAFNDDAKKICEAQQHVFVEGSCNDQACQAGECSSCYSESSCGSYAWCSWGAGDDGAAGSCVVPSCEEGKEPNVEEWSCDLCEAGKYSNAVSNDACTGCASGRYSEVVGSVNSRECVECEEGKVSGIGYDACLPITGVAASADHGWDFRGCVDGEVVVDEGAGSELKATLMNGALCTAEGVAFDGVDDYVDLDDWQWGGALTIEVYVRERSNTRECAKRAHTTLTYSSFMPSLLQIRQVREIR